MRHAVCDGAISVVEAVSERIRGKKILNGVAKHGVVSSRLEESKLLSIPFCDLRRFMERALMGFKKRNVTMTTLTENASGDQKQGVEPDAGSHLRMHQEHREWLNDIKTWRDDIVEWEAESRKLSAELKELVSIIEEHARVLVAHSEAIFAHHQMLAKHEHLLAQFEQGGPGDELVGCSCAHHEELERHAQQKACHETTKHLHRILISQWEHLHKAISQLPKS